MVAEVSRLRVINKEGSSVKLLKDHKNSHLPKEEEGEEENFSLLHQGHKRLHNLSYLRGVWETKHIFQELVRLR